MLTTIILPLVQIAAWARSPAVLSASVTGGHDRGRTDGRSHSRGAPQPVDDCLSAGCCSLRSRECDPDLGEWSLCGSLSDVTHSSCKL